MKATHLLLTAHKHILASYMIVGRDNPTVRRWKESDIIHYREAMMLFYILIHTCY